MAKFNVTEIDNYGGNAAGGSFFSLKNDKDVATVRFMYNTLQDVQGYAVHEVEVDGKKRYANCLRSYNDPIDDCPLCAARYKVLAKIFVTLYDEESGEVKIWDRGKTFMSKLSSLCSRYNPLVATPFEIERNGKKGDQKTTYETYALESDDVTLDDLPEVPELLGTLILDKTYEELESFLDTGSFGDEKEEAPVQSRNPRTDRRQASAPTSQRRTPAATSTRLGMSRRTPANTDKF